jgi:hypothetical protein
LSPIVPEEDEEASKSADEQFENGEKLDGKKNLSLYRNLLNGGSNTWQLLC